MLEEIRCGHCDILHKPNNGSEMLGLGVGVCVPPRDGAPLAIVAKSRH